MPLVPSRKPLVTGSLKENPLNIEIKRETHTVAVIRMPNMGPIGISIMSVSFI